MANKQIKDFPSVNEPSAGDLLHISRGGVDNKITVENFLPVLGGFGSTVVDTFDAPGGFTPGVTSALSLSRTLISKNSAWVFFDGIYQEKETYNVAGNIITFDEVIPEGVTTVEIVTPILLPIGITTSADQVQFEEGVNTHELLAQNIVFNTVTAMKNATWLMPGFKVRTLGYNSIGDGGGNDYEIVAAATGTDDGGSFIDLPGSGLQARGLFPLGFMSVRQWGGFQGGSDVTTIIESAISHMNSSGLKELRFPDSGPDNEYVTTAKPAGGVAGLTFVFEGGARLSDNTHYPDGTCVFGFNQQGTETSFSQVRIQSDTVDQESISGSKVNGQKVIHNISGGHTGGRHGIYGIVLFNAASDPASVDRNYVGVQGQIIANSSDGGTGTGAGTGKGAFFGISAIANADASATNLLNLTGGEFNTAMEAGSSVWLKTGIQVVDKSQTQGTIDSALLVGASGSSIGWKTGLSFATTNGGAPIASTGTLIKNEGSFSVARGIDFTGLTFSGPILTAPSFTLSNTGSLELGSLTAPQSTTVDFHSSGNNIDYDARIVASGGGGVVGQGALGFQALTFTFNNSVRSTADDTHNLGQPTFRWLNTFSRQLRPGDGTPIWTSGSGSPEGSVTAVVGSMYTDVAGGAGTTLYVKESGAGNTGWVAK